jgi:hypothetical protein
METEKETGMRHFEFFTAAQIEETIRLTTASLNAILANGGTAAQIADHCDVISHAQAELRAREEERARRLFPAQYGPVRNGGEVIPARSN